VLALRIGTGFVAVPILILLAADRGWLFLLGVFGCGLLGTWEALWMARQAGHRPLAPFAILTTFVILADAALASPGGIGAGLGLARPGRILGPALGIIVVSSLTVLLVRAEHSGSLTDWALTLALPLYVAGLLQFFIPLRERGDNGPWIFTWPALVLTTSWACDMAAYFAGRAWGTVRLAPLISPAKTREGAVAGLVAAAGLGALFSPAIGLDPLRMAGFGLAVGLGSVMGDLAESLLKRQCGVKDSGFIMPGHGGILDRMDALIFAAASAYFYLQAPL
jgi:phosphatidate cytidylyltransferase